MKKFMLLLMMVMLLSLPISVLADSGTGLARASNTPTKSSLLRNIRSRSSKKVQGVYYSDYDGDGRGELFAVLSDEVDDDKGNKGDLSYGELWFSSYRTTQHLIPEYDSFCPHVTGSYGRILKTGGKQKIFTSERYAHGSGSSSLCWYVKNGYCREIDMKYSEHIKHLSGNDFTIYGQAFDLAGIDKGGHTHKLYYIRWTGNKFVEYKARKISEGRLKKYKGASSILKKIRKGDYKIISVYKRSNGLIHINVKKKLSEYNSYHYDNVTLKIKGKRVSVITINKKEKDIVKKSSYGGVYLASGFKSR